MKLVNLFDICQPKQWKTISNKDLKESGYLAYGANGVIGYYDKYNHKEPTIVIGCRGTCGSVHITEPFSYTSGNAMALDLLDSKSVDIKYLYHYLKYRGFNDVVSGGVQPQITGQGLRRIEIPFPTIIEQKRIATLLDKAQHVLQKQKIRIDNYNDLAQSLFIEMFGDLENNSNNYKASSLIDVANIVSGVTKNASLKNEGMVNVPYMRVANVQDGYLNLTEIKNIDATESDFEKYLLKEGDVLLTEGGDPDKLGRGAVWNNEIENCIHQNHIFRVRVNFKVLNPKFLSAQFGSKYGKKYFLKAAKQTTGIASINSTQLKAFPVRIPSIKLQNKYANLIEKIENQKNTTQLALSQSEVLLISLGQKAFKTNHVKNNEMEEMLR